MAALDSGLEDSACPPVESVEAQHRATGDAGPITPPPTGWGDLFSRPSLARSPNPRNGIGLGSARGWEGRGAPDRARSPTNAEGRFKKVPMVTWFFAAASNSSAPLPCPGLSPEVLLSAIGLVAVR